MYHVCWLTYQAGFSYGNNVSLRCAALSFYMSKRREQHTEPLQTCVINNIWHPYLTPTLILIAYR